ncbi:hypothetical protein GOV05_05030 [Candidatus Woesearchaeota archaeon]|nr:hypothetical protein [Candidatus Woesearchaeota archaeon]
MKRGKGRPRGSGIRDNIIEILYFLKKGYGYEIHKIYSAVFGKVTQRSIYYNLQKGLSIGEFELVEVKKEKGDYSWGETTTKNIYKLGKNSNPRIDVRVKKYLEKK